MRNKYPIPKIKKDIVKLIDATLDEAITKTPDTSNDAWKNKIIYGDDKRPEIEESEAHGGK